MQGVFSSNVSSTPAIAATATNGAAALNASLEGVGRAVVAVAEQGTAVNAGTANGLAIAAVATGTGIGVRASARSGTGVSAQTTSGIGVWGRSDSNNGVLGECLGNDFGVVGKAQNAGVAAFNSQNSHAAYLASNCCAAWFTGEVHVAGPLMKSGGGFRIDHPLAPDTEYLSHSFVESSDMKNLYDGVVVLDANGAAVVELPRWFSALNDVTLLMDSVATMLSAGDLGGLG
jgi:hypothetical protein